MPQLPPRREWQAPEYTPPFDKRSPRSFLRFFFGPFLRNLHVTGPDSLLPTRVSRAGAALRAAGLSPRFAGGQARPSVVGASQTYEDFITGFVAWVQANVAPYPQPPPELRSGELMPALLPQYEDDLAYVRALERGPFPEVIRGRPAALSPQATDPLQNGLEASRPPGYAFTAPGNQEKGTAWRAWEAAEAAKRAKGRVLGVRVGGGLAGLGGDGGRGGKRAAATAKASASASAAEMKTAAAAAAAAAPGEDDEKGAPWLRALIKRFDDPQEL